MRTLRSRYQMTEADKNRKNNDTKTRASITILILSLIYVICNTTSIIIWTVIYWQYLSLTTVKHVSWLQLGLIYFSGTTMFLISSTLTPFVLVSRGGVNHGMKQFVSTIFTRVSVSLSSSRSGRKGRSDPLQLQNV